MGLFQNGATYRWFHFFVCRRFEHFDGRFGGTRLLHLFIITFG